MRLLLDIDGRYERAPDGSIWVRSGCYYDYWRRFLEVFDEVCLMARAHDVADVGSGLQRVDGDGVTFAGVPFFMGPTQYMLNAGAVRAAATSAVRWGDAVVLCGCTTSCAVQSVLRKVGYPYAMRVIGNPRDTFAPGSVRHPLRPVFRMWFPRVLKKLCLQAAAATYVTQHTLQESYPCGGLSVGVSDVDLAVGSFVPSPRPGRPMEGRAELVFVGGLAQLYKAQDVTIEAVARCVRQGSDVGLTVVGDGRHRDTLERLTARLGMGERVRFVGQLPNEEVRRYLDAADVFVLASRQEGLPRAMVEAMARALPCIGSTAGGIPELLGPEDMVPAGDAGALSRKICEVLSNPMRMAEMSERNLLKAREFAEDRLRERSMCFYVHVKETTKEWLETCGRSSFCM